MAAEPILGELVEPLLDRRWLYGVRAGVTALVLLAFWSRYAELRDPRRPPAGDWVWGALLGTVVFLFWILLDSPPLVLGEPDPFDPRVDGRIHAGLAVVRLTGSALIVPVMEELFWRSFLMRWLHHARFTRVDPRSVGWKPLVMTSVVFALEHRLWFAGILAGLVYGQLYRRTGDIRVVILAHAVTNGLLGVYILATGSWDFW